MFTGCRRIVGGTGEGPALVTNQPINFLSMVDTKSGMVTDRHHELHGQSIKDTILIFPYAVGSSVGAYAIYSLKDNHKAPKAMVCSKADITTASGCAIAMIPVVNLPTGAKVAPVSPGTIAGVDARTEWATVKI
jgi:predicted aconitase with swiveling domain